MRRLILKLYQKMYSHRLLPRRVWNLVYDKYHAAMDAAFYRKRPYLFARDYLHLNLRVFQRILLILTKNTFNRREFK